MVRGWQYTKLSLSSALLRVARVLRVCTMHPFFLYYVFPARPYILRIFSGIWLLYLVWFLFCFLFFSLLFFSFFSFCFCRFVLVLFLV